jgi:hypothetical protein
MIHDELIAILDDLDVALDNGFGKASTFIACTKAVRKVIELHKPFQFENGPDEYKPVCFNCQHGIVGDTYPCETIQAIEKELK